MTIDSNMFWKIIVVVFLAGTAHSRLGQIETRLGQIEARLPVYFPFSGVPKPNLQAPRGIPKAGDLPI